MNMAEIKVGQRYRLYPNRRGGFVAEVLRVVSSSEAELKVIQDLGYGVDIGHVFTHESVLSSDYELLLGQEAPST